MFKLTIVVENAGLLYISVRAAKYSPDGSFYYFGAVNAIEALHRNPVFKADWKKNNVDITKSRYRSGPDSKRLYKSTGGKPLHKTTDYTFSWQMVLNHTILKHNPSRVSSYSILCQCCVFSSLMVLMSLML